MVENRSDDQYWEDIPSNFWLQGRSCVALLAALVHRDKADIRPNPADAPPGGSRNQVRAEARARTQEERQAARIASLEDQDIQFKRAKLAATQGMVIKQQNDAVDTQLSMFEIEKCRAPYVQVKGEEAYNQKIVDLLDSLPPTQAASSGSDESA